MAIACLSALDGALGPQPEAGCSGVRPLAACLTHVPASALTIFFRLEALDLDTSSASLQDPRAMEDHDNVYRSPKSDPFPVADPPSGEGYRYLRDPHRLTSFLIIMLWVSLALDGISIVNDLSQMALLERPTFTEAEAEANDQRQMVVGLAVLAVFIVTGITFLKWIYRASSNSRGFGASGLTITPGWSVGYYFIPFANLIKPYHAMKEISQVSENPSNWQMSSGAPILRWWWALWITCGILGNISFRMDASTIPELKNATAVALIYSALSIILTLVAISLVKGIIRNQDALVDGAQAPA